MKNSTYKSLTILFGGILIGTVIVEMWYRSGGMEVPEINSSIATTCTYALLALVAFYLIKATWDLIKN